MRFYNDDNEEDEFTEDEVTLAKGFCDSCDKGILTAYEAEEYDIIISNLMFLGCIASLACFLAWTWVMDKLGAVVATNYVYLNPLVTIVCAWWILSEAITPWFLLGTGLIIAGMYLADKNNCSAISNEKSIINN
jgi:hypothetical protein